MIICICICHAYHTLSMINHHTVNRAIMQRPRMKMKMKYCIINDYLFCKNGSGVFSKVEIVQFFAVLQPITIHHLSYISRDCIPLDYFLWYKRGLTMLFWSNGSETKADHLLDWLLVSIVWRCPLISSTELFPHFLSHFNTFLKSYIFFAFCLRFTAFPFIFKQQCWEILRLE